jgi:hypothetical protein
MRRKIKTDIAKKESKKKIKYNVTGLAHKRKTRRPLDKLYIFLLIPAPPPPPTKRSIIRCF